jgi:predicted transcriptional regulator
MDFNTAAQLGSYLSKDYAEEFFGLLVNYQDISASEAASRIGLHVRTAQDFLEGLSALGILRKEEVSEGKRPYYRYTLAVDAITLEIDLGQFRKTQTAGALSRQIRERARAGAHFSVARGGGHISQVSLWIGEGRDRQERRINLTLPQGKFLYHLPFPQAAPASVEEIMRQADVDAACAPEILDLVELLEGYRVIEVV